MQSTLHRSYQRCHLPSHMYTHPSSVQPTAHRTPVHQSHSQSPERSGNETEPTAARQTLAEARVRALVLRMRSSGEWLTLGGLGELYSTRLSSMASMVFSRERTPRPASSSTFFTVFSKLDTLLTITWGGGVGGGRGTVSRWAGQCQQALCHAVRAGMGFYRV